MSVRVMALRLLGYLERTVIGFARMGRGSVIKPFPRSIRGAKYVEIGDNCFFGDGLTLSAVDEYRGRRHTPKCIIGDGCTFGSDLFISCTKRIVIGKNVLTSARVFIGDSYHGYHNIELPILHQPMEGEAEIVIGDGCFLGIGCAIMPGVTLGRGCVVGANAVVTKSFAPLTVLAGVPARAIRRYDQMSQAWIQLFGGDS